MREVALGDVLELVIDHRGKTPSKLGGDFTSTGVPVVSAIHIKDGRIEWSERERYVSSEMFRKWMPQRLAKGDVLLTSEAPLGETAQVPSDDDLVLSQRLFALRGKRGVLDSTYLRYFLESRTGQERLRERATGTTVLGIRQSELMKVRVPLPPFEEQQRIGQALGAIDSLVDLNRLLILQLHAIAKALYAQAAGTATGTRPLGKVVSVNPLQTKAKTSGSIRYVDIASVGDGTISWPERSPWADAPSRARRLALSGSTIWSTVRPNRRAHVLLTHVPEDLVVSTGFAVLVPKEIGPAETYCATDRQEFVDYLMSRAEGSAYPAVRGSVFEEAPIAELSREESLRFEEKAWPLLVAAGELDQEARELTAVRDELLPLLISGRVQVGEVAA